MGIFSKITGLFSRKKKDKKEEKKKEVVNWDELNYGKPAQPTNLTPIDIDPWKT
jgi:hypothetical protein